MRAAICDDEREFLALFKQEFDCCTGKLDLDMELFCFEDPLALTDTAKTEAFSLVFLDIEMPGINGFDLAKGLQDSQADCKIIFVSQRSDLVFDSFLYQPIGFIRKNCLRTELLKYLREYRNRYCSDLIVEFKMDKMVMRVHSSDITFIESDRNYVIIRLKNKDEYRIRSNLSSWEERLKQEPFIRIHSAYIVNCRYIENVGKNSIVLQSGTELFVSRERMNRLRAAFSAYLVGKDRLQ